MFFGGLGHGCKSERDVGGDLLELREVDLYFLNLILHVPKHIKRSIIGKISRNISLDLANHVVVVRQELENFNLLAVGKISVVGKCAFQVLIQLL
jgi:hypothetical protein